MGMENQHCSCLWKLMPMYIPEVNQGKSLVFKLAKIPVISLKTSKHVIEDFSIKGTLAFWLNKHNSNTANRIPYLLMSHIVSVHIQLLVLKQASDEHLCVNQTLAFKILANFGCIKTNMATLLEYTLMSLLESWLSSSARLLLITTLPSCVPPHPSPQAGTAKSPFLASIWAVACSQEVLTSVFKTVLQPDHIP